MAFGNLKFDTLTTSDTKNTSTEKSIDTSYLFNGIIKHWQDSNNRTTITDSFNQSTLTDNGTGDYTVTFTSSMSNVYYPPLHFNNPHDNTSGSRMQICGTRLDSERTTSSYECNHGKIWTGSAGAHTDGYTASSVVGDLA